MAQKKKKTTQNGRGFGGKKGGGVKGVRGGGWGWGVGGSVIAITA
jgi:hypothetical protein